jgi:hypothetical protein|tara:strand:- start:1197 stop:1304 length:108 start_codon:yes stop_codon:yes gene_type:complete
MSKDTLNHIIKRLDALVKELASLLWLLKETNERKR